MKSRWTRIWYLSMATIALLALPRAAPAYCRSPPPPPRPCALTRCLPTDNSWEYYPRPNGTVCNTWGYCDGVNYGCNMPETDSVYPKFLVASVIYVPPGSKGKSYVEYGNGSKVGTSLATTNSYKNTYSVQVDTSFSIGVFSGGINYDWSQTFSGSNTTKTDLIMGWDSALDYPCGTGAGTCSDYVDHNQDQILLLLDAVMNAHVFPNPSIIPSNIPALRWSHDLSRAAPQIVKVSWLNGSEPMPANVQYQLQLRGINTAPNSPELAQMLKAHPYASDLPGASKPDPSRFAYVTVYAYEPDLGDSDTYTMNNSYTTTDTTTSETSTTVGVTVTGSAFKQSLKVSDQVTYTYSSSNSNSLTSSDLMKLVLYMPSSYTVPTLLYVYVDKIFKTFMFSFVSPW